VGLEKGASGFAEEARRVRLPVAHRLDPFCPFQSRSGSAPVLPASRSGRRTKARTRAQKVAEIHRHDSGQGRRYFGLEAVPEPRQERLHFGRFFEQHQQELTRSWPTAQETRLEGAASKLSTKRSSRSNPLPGAWLTTEVDVRHRGPFGAERRRARQRRPRSGRCGAWWVLICCVSAHLV
jgi:hypothetical protein